MTLPFLFDDHFNFTGSFDFVLFGCAAFTIHEHNPLLSLVAAWIQPKSRRWLHFFATTLYQFCPATLCDDSRQLIVVHIGSYYVRSCWLYLKLAVSSFLSPVLQVELTSQCLKHLKPQHNLFDQDYLARIVPTRGCVDLFDAEAIHLSTTDLRHPSPRKPFWSSARTGRTREAPEKWCAMRTCQLWLAWTSPFNWKRQKSTCKLL